MTNQSEETQLAVIQRDVGYLRKELDSFRDEIKEWKNEFVTKAEFKPVRAIAYTMVGVTSITALGALLSLIFR